MKPYEKYVPSGVEWIGDIPEGWEVKKLKYIGDAIIGLTYSPENIVASENDGVLVFRSSNVQNGKITYDDNVYVDTKISEKLMVKSGDILICSRNGSKALIGKNALISEGDEGHTFGAFMTIFRSRFYRFLHYVLNSNLFEVQADSCMTTTVNQLTTGNLNSMQVAIPDPDTQTAIADYLDWETARIDNIINAKERLVDLLKEKRTALITHAVTKGLDPNVKMKPSGVKWIGDIPEGWEVKKIKYIAQKPLMYGANESPDDFDETQPRYIRITDIDENGKLRDDIAVSLDIEKAKPYLLKKDDILFARSGATVGKSYIFNQDILACFAGYMIKFEPKKTKIVPKFAYYITFSKMYLNWIESNTIQATIQNVSAEKYNNFYLPLPHVELQDAIVAFLNAETSKLDAATEKTKLSIKKLKEYRTALISSCVTGKIDVRSV